MQTNPTISTARVPETKDADMGCEEKCVARNKVRSSAFHDRWSQINQLCNERN